jgi:hypothetical protein
MRFMVSLCLSGVVLLAPSGAQGAEVRETRRNLVGFELGGRAGIYSVSYERYLANRVGVGMAGAALLDEGVVGLVPVYVSFLPVGNIHSLYLSVGALVAAGLSFTDNLFFWPTVTVGYQFQSQEGFFLRLSVSNFGLWALPGIALGGSF